MSSILPQTITKPNYALKSHETLVIEKIEIEPEATTFYLSIENRTTGGYFCADKNIFIIYPDESRSRLISSNGIPVCPDIYKFKIIGEKLDFILRFSPLKQGAEWIDLIEDCSDNCFSFYGVTLNPDLNRSIDDAFILIENGETDRAMAAFIDIAEEIDNNNPGVEGLLYVNIITLANETGNTAKASEWYQRMISSEAPRLQLFIKHLNSQGIKY
jgi:hypothetical protein